MNTNIFIIIKYEYSENAKVIVFMRLINNL